MSCRYWALVVVCIFSGNLNSQSFNDQIYQSYVTGDMDKWESALKTNGDRGTNPEDQYNYALACYGFIGYMIGEDEKSRARPFLDSAEKVMDKLLIVFPDEPKYLALRVALYGFRMEYQPRKIPGLLPKATKTLSLAQEFGPESPQVRIETGNRFWFTPSSFGGSRIEAVAEYEKAITLMAGSPEFIRNNWYYLKVHKILIGWYEKMNFSFQAKQKCRKLLAIEPEFKWAQVKMAKLTKK